MYNFDEVLYMSTFNVFSLVQLESDKKGKLEVKCSKTISLEEARFIYKHRFNKIYFSQSYRHFEHAES